MIKEITDKKLVNEFEGNSVPLINIRNMDKFDSFDIYYKIIGWYHYHDDIDVNMSVYKKWDKISELLGFSPIYHKTYLHKNAVWCFHWKSDMVLIYYDKRGIQIQVSPKFKESEVKIMLTYLEDILTKKIK